MILAAGVEMDDCDLSMREAADEIAQMDEMMMDDRAAAVNRLQQIQQKREQMALLESHPVTNADAEFRRGLEELVQDHLNTCMALASCSSPHDISRTENGPSSYTSSQGDSSRQEECDEEHFGDLQDVEDVSGESSYASTSFQTLSAERLQEELDVEDEAERERTVHSQERMLDEGIVQNPSSGESPGRRQSRILHIWDTRAEEMITTLERQAREAELLALAGQHTVSMLDASFLQEAPTSRPESILERGHRRASSLVQMWRGIVGERNVGMDRNPTEATPQHELEVPSQTPTGSTGGDADYSLERTRSGNSAIQTDELMRTRVDSQRVWVGDEQQVGNRATASSLAAELGEMDRERVRQIVQHWARQSVVSNIEADVRGSQDGLNPWLGQNERERVRRLVRTWMETSSQRSTYPQGPDVGRVTGDMTAERNEVREIGDTEFGRQRQEASEMVVEVLMRIERERQRELERLTELRSVSDFSQRNRLQVQCLKCTMMPNL